MSKFESFNEDRVLLTMSSQDSPRQFFLSDHAVSKLEHKLVSQNGSSTLNLSDAFIGDEGCKFLAEYIKENIGIQVLELRGNNISQEGLNELLPVLRSQNCISHVSLEWNNIGNEIMQLAEVLMYNDTLKVLDLRNNRIGPEGAGFLAKMLEKNRCLVKLDLRWNELATSGARLLIESLQKPHKIQIIELSGNKIPDDFIQEIENLLSSEITYEPSPFKPLHDAHIRENNYEDVDFLTQIEILKLNLKKSDSRVNELEILLDQESQRTYEIQNELLKELDEEKLRRNYAEDEIVNHKEICVEKESETNRIIEELKSRNYELESEKRSLIKNLTENQENHRLYINSSNEKINNFETRLIKQQKLYKQLDESSRNSFERAKQDYETSISEVLHDSQIKLKIAEESLNYLKNIKDELEHENRNQRNQISSMKMSHNEQLIQIENRIRDEENTKFSILIKNLEKRMKAVEESREILTEKNNELQQEIFYNDKNSHEQINNLEKLTNQLRDDKNDMQRSLQRSQIIIENTKNELNELRSNLDRCLIEKEEINRNQNERKEYHTKQIEKVKIN